MSFEPARTRITLLVTALVLVAGGLMASPGTEVPGTVTKVDVTSIHIDTDSGDRMFLIDADTIQPEPIEPSDGVIVSLSEDDDPVADRILKIHDRVLVTEETVDEHRAVLGTVKATGTDGMIIETAWGGSTFLVRPDELFPPLPTPGDKVGVIYRVQELAKWDRALAQEIVLLPADLELPAPVEISYEETPQQPATETAETAEPIETVTETTVATTEAETRSTLTELPQTAGHLPAIGLAGMAALSAGLGLRSLRRRD